MLSGRNQPQKTTYYMISLIQISRMGESVETSCGQSSWRKPCGAGMTDLHLECIYSSEDKSLLPPRWKRFSVVTSVISVARLWLTLRNLMDCSTPGFPVHHQLPELAQTHVHWVSDDIQTSHPLSSPFPPAFNPSQHQGLCKWVSSSHQVARVLELQDHFFQWIFRTDFL